MDHGNANNMDHGNDINMDHSNDNCIYDDINNIDENDFDDNNIHVYPHQHYLNFSPRAYEVTNRLEQIRGFLHARLRTSTLRHDDEGTAVLTNLLLRNYTSYSLFDQVWR